MRGKGGSAQSHNTHLMDDLNDLPGIGFNVFPEIGRAVNIIVPFVTVDFDNNCCPFVSGDICNLVDLKYFT